MRVDTQVILDEVAERCPSSSALLRDIDEPLIDYARRVYTPAYRPTSPLSIDARDRLESAAYRTSGVRLTMRLPVVQTGPHHRFALDDDYFPTLMFSVLGSAAAGLQQNTMYTCSTVTLEEKVRRGPAWLRVDGEPTKAFAMPRRLLAKRSVLLHDEPVEVTDELVKRVEDLSERSGLRLDPELLGGKRTVRDHISVFNRHLFDRLHDANGVFTEALDEWFFANLLADSLESESLLERLFSDGRLLRASRSLRGRAASPLSRLVPNSTELFWLNTDGKIRPLQAENGVLHSSRTGAIVPFDVGSVVAALRAHILVPNLFLVFCLTSILPLVRAVGGAYQAVYHEVFTDAVAGVLDEGRQDERMLRQELQHASLVAWGHNLINRNPVNTSLSGAHVPTWLGRAPIVELSDYMSAFTCDKLWADLCGCPAGGR